MANPAGLAVANGVTGMFEDLLDQHGHWRREFRLGLKLLTEWLGNHELLAAPLQQSLSQMLDRLREERLAVAFVAEPGRGRSDVANALFFAGSSRRIMPAGDGRAIVCPTELRFDGRVPACVRLLPIETRLQPQSLLEWRKVPDEWLRVDLDLDDAAQVARTVDKVMEVRQVPPEEALALGFWGEGQPDGPARDAQGMVTVPRWRHALVNFGHPLLRQGLVVLALPGPDTMGFEPELGFGLIAQAQAVLFVLGADTGVTESDLAIWRGHLVAEEPMAGPRLVVLNKIDTLWDGQNTRDEIRSRLESQREATAQALGLQAQQVLAVSAHMGTQGKLGHDADLLAASGLPLLEQAMGEALLARRRSELRQQVVDLMEALRRDAGRVLQVRRRSLDDQMAELRGLRGKGAAMMRHMATRVARELEEFDAASARIQALRVVQQKMLREVFELLARTGLKQEITQLAEALAASGPDSGPRAACGQAFQRLRANLAQAAKAMTEIRQMLEAGYAQLNADHGLSLLPAPPPALAPQMRQIDGIEKLLDACLDTGHASQLAQPAFAERLARAIGGRVRELHDAALAEVDRWGKLTMSQLDTQLREHRQQFERRLATIEQVQQAPGGLDARLAELQQQDGKLAEVEVELRELTQRQIDGPVLRPPRPGRERLAA